MRINKKLLCVILTSVFCLLCTFLVFFHEKQKSISTQTDIEGNNNYEYTVSVFLNDFQTTAHSTAQSLDVREEEKFWFINGTKYLLCETSFSATSSTVCWRVDLSLLSICGASEDVYVFSSTGDCDSEILVAKKNDVLFLLVRNEILDAHQYSLTDFNVIDKVKTDEYYETLWNAHLSEKNNLTFLLSDEPFEFVWLRLKEHPELVYPLTYQVYHEEFYSYTPANKNNQAS